VVDAFEGDFENVEEGGCVVECCEQVVIGGGEIENSLAEVTFVGQWVPDSVGPGNIGAEDADSIDCLIIGLAVFAAASVTEQAGGNPSTVVHKWMIEGAVV